MPDSQELQTLLNQYLKNHPNSEVQLADELRVSIPTIRRWRKGTKPRKHIYKKMVASLKSKLRAG